MIVWPLTQGWCDDVMTGHARVTVPWHPVTNVMNIHLLSLSISNIFAAVSWAKSRMTHLCWWCRVSQDPAPWALVDTGGPRSSPGDGAQDTAQGGNWCLAWYVHTHNGAIHDGEILSRDGSAQQLTIIGLSSPFHNLTVSRHWYGDG